VIILATMLSAIVGTGLMGFLYGRDDMICNGSDYKQYSRIMLRLGSEVSDYLMA
jgi:hypothetical protein